MAFLSHFRALECISKRERAVMHAAPFLVLLLVMPTAHLQGGQVAVSRAVRVESNPAHMTTTHHASEGTCRVSWTVYHAKVNEGVIRHQSQCALPFSVQAELISAILESVLTDATVAQTFHTLFVGALGSFPHKSAQLSALATESPDWDASKGQAKSGTTNRFIVKLANDAQLYREWDDLFRRFGRTVQVSSVESVLVTRAGDLPIFPELARRGLARTDRVPQDAMVWLSVTLLGEK